MQGCSRDTQIESLFVGSFCRIFGIDNGFTSSDHQIFFRLSIYNHNIAIVLYSVAMLSDCLPYYSKG